MRTTTTKLAFLLATGLLVWGSALAGSLDPPPGPPAPTMVTLQQIYDKLGAPGVVARTGEIDCSDDFGNLISCAGTGQDGEFMKGAFASPRFTDNADGTVRDNLTGLIWLKNADCFGEEDNWTDALFDANTLASGACGLTDGSVAGAWRLPNIRELHSLFDFTQYLPALPAGHPFSGVQNRPYWSSTSRSGGGALIVAAADGFIEIVAKATSPQQTFVWPVRGGQ